MEKKTLISEMKKIPLYCRWMKFLIVFFVIGTASVYADGLSDKSVTQNSTVTGKVTDASTGEELIGVTVVVKETQMGAITTVDGTYVIFVPNKTSTSLVFSFLGFTTKEVEVNNRSVVDVALEPTSHQLNEVVVTALGIKRETKALGYSVSTINAGDLTVAAAPNLGSALYGKAAGVRVQTSPGGVQGAISINIRGINSLTQTNLPLVIVDGTPIHNGDTNNDGYWTNQRIRSNGLADINPEDIESLSILKGAAASALYGSEAANGVVIITTKAGRSNLGTGVDFNASLTFDPVAYMPQYQTKYGPGIPAPDRYPNSDAEGWQQWTDRNGNSYRRAYPTTLYFGPKYDGQDVLYYDGTLRKYSPINANPWTDVFRTGVTQQYNLAVSNANEKSNLRFSYTYMDNQPTQYNSTFKKNNFNLGGNYNVTKNIKLGYGVTYMIQSVKNPPYRLSRVLNNFGGMFGPFDDVNYLRNTTRTSLGYMNSVYSDSNHLTPNEGYEWTPSCYSLVSEYFWNIFAKEYSDNTNRLLANVTPSWEIVKGLTLKGRLATDYTTDKIESKEQAAQRPTVLNPNQGYYSLSNNRYSIIYGDVMLNYDAKLTDKWGLNAIVGWTGRTEEACNASVSTNSGLSVENWFNLNASNKPANASEVNIQLLKTAFFGDLSFSYDNWAYLNGTIRQEKTSTLAPGHNTFNYPSVSGSAVYSELLKNQLPSWYDYGKIRASYGVVGNCPPPYAANQAYVQQSIGGQWIYNGVNNPIGNPLLRPEKKFEWEFGWENKFFKDRLGFELTYYTNRVQDQLLQVTMPASSGGTSLWMNVGELKNKGVELSLYGTPVATRNLKWNLRGNFAWNKNTVIKLAEGIDQITHTNWDNGSAFLYSKVGESAGDIYALAPKQDANGNYIIRDDGYYQLTDQPVKVGNALPKLIGGFATTLTYKNVVFDISFDYRIGGAVMNMPYQYMMGRGAIKESLKYHDGEGAGLTYYMNNGDLVPFKGSKGPKGERVYDNGIILNGVTADGKPNTTMIGGDEYLWYTYNWGGYDPTDVTYYSHGIFDNSYVKCRELSIAYNIPHSALSKIKCKGLQLSVFGRNLFYLYKNLPMLDAEAADGTSWITQANIGGSTTTTRSIGVSLRATF